MRHPRLVGYAAIAWAMAVAAGLAASLGSALVWLVPVAAAATVTLPFRGIRTLAWVLPVTAVASVDQAAGWPRVGLALLSVGAAIAAVGLLEIWADARPDRAVAGSLDPAGRAGWWAARRRELTRLGGGLLVAAAGWTGLAAVSWSPPGWVVALVPVAAALAVAAALWPQWRLSGPAPNRWRPRIET